MKPFLLCVILASATFAADGKWTLAWFHDSLDTTLRLRSIQFPTEQSGYALGSRVDRAKRRVEPVLAMTRDGGTTWRLERLEDEPVSLYCNAEDICWIAAGKGVYQSEEGGLRWRRISSQKGILRLYFDSATHGWAAGLEHQAWETHDGGRTWTLLEAAKSIKANPAHSYFSEISFLGPLGFIAGNSRPPRPLDSIYPDWMAPEETARRRELPGMMLLLETRDGGKNWHSSSASLFGLVGHIQILPGARAVALLEYRNSFSSPSAVLQIQMQNGRSQTIHEDKNLAVTGLVEGPGGTLVLGGVEVNSVRALGIPGKVKILTGELPEGSARTVWQEMPVDYRAAATRVELGKKPSGQLWAATDTGMILRFDPAIKMVPAPANAATTAR
jgi:photosystem II stability/assembly factor-like uncharacterized protein